jgi:hypothetical protein
MNRLGHALLIFMSLVHPYNKATLYFLGSTELTVDLGMKIAGISQCSDYSGGCLTEESGFDSR